MISTLLAVTMAALTAAAEKPPQPADCTAELGCHFVSDMALTLDDGSAFRIQANIWAPYVGPDRREVFLLPGDMVVLKPTIGADGRMTFTVVQMGRADDLPLEAMQKQLVQDADAGKLSFDKPSDMKRSTELAALPPLPPRTIRLSLRQVPGRPDMILTVEQNLDRMVDYHAEIQNGGERGEPTTVCEVTPGPVMFEHWPNAFPQINLKDFRIGRPPAEVKGQADIPCD